MSVPTAGRPLMPAGYGVPETDQGLLDWSWAVERLEPAPTYWFSTTRPDGRPCSRMSVLVGLVFAASVRGYVRRSVDVGYSGGVRGSPGYVDARRRARDVRLDDVHARRRAGRSSTPSAAQALNVVSNDSLLHLPGRYGRIHARQRGRDRALGRPAQVGSVASVSTLGIIAVTPVGWFALFGVLGWTLVVSILMFIRQGKEASATARAPAGPAPAA